MSEMSGSRGILEGGLLRTGSNRGRGAVYGLRQRDHWPAENVVRVRGQVALGSP